MHLRPMLSSLRHHKTMVSLIVLEIALTCAVLCNALFLCLSHVQRMQADSGMQEAGLAYVDLSRVEASQAPPGQGAQLLARWRSTPGVQSTAALNQIPFGNNSTRSGIALEPSTDQRINAETYRMSAGGVATLGLKLLQGRDFVAEDFPSQADQHASVLLINDITARQLFGERSPLGEKIYGTGGAPARVIGVVQGLGAVYPRDNPEPQPSVILPVHTGPLDGGYVLRLQAGHEEAALKAVRADINALGPDFHLNLAKPVSEMRADYHARTRYSAALLALVCALLLAVTAFGLVGLASFWVQSRQRSLGIRRALGATEGQILRYFLLENALLTGFGLVLGLAGAYGLNQLLMLHYEVSRLPLDVLPLALGQLAVLMPARRAAKLAPMEALRA